MSAQTDFIQTLLQSLIGALSTLDPDERDLQFALIAAILRTKQDELANSGQ